MQAFLIEYKSARDGGEHIQAQAGEAEQGGYRHEKAAKQGKKNDVCRDQRRPAAEFFYQADGLVQDPARRAAGRACRDDGQDAVHLPPNSFLMILPRLAPKRTP